MQHYIEPRPIQLGAYRDGGGLRYTVYGVATFLLRADMSGMTEDRYDVAIRMTDVLLPAAERVTIWRLSTGALIFHAPNIPEVEIVLLRLPRFSPLLFCDYDAFQALITTASVVVA